MTNKSINDNYLSITLKISIFLKNNITDTLGRVDTMQFIKTLDILIILVRKENLLLFCWL